MQINISKIHILLQILQQETKLLAYWLSCWIISMGCFVFATKPHLHAVATMVSFREGMFCDPRPLKSSQRLSSAWLIQKKRCSDWTFGKGKSWGWKVGLKGREETTWNTQWFGCFSESFEKMQGGSFWGGNEPSCWWLKSCTTRTFVLVGFLLSGVHGISMDGFDTGDWMIFLRGTT